ncbi:MAG: hypothetical protein K1X75_13450 [Leptospirales bacterium]|nr:hypothetical protein [Leptospirales bacterium]
MSKFAVVLMSDTEGGEALGRAVNAIKAVEEMVKAGAEVQLIFTGAGTKWIPELQKSDHLLHSAFMNVRGTVKGACAFCARAFNMEEHATKSGIQLLAEFEQNMSYLKLAKAGFTILTF